MKVMSKIGMLLFVIAIFASFSFAQGDGPRMCGMKDDLNLTDQQKSDIEKLKIDQQKEMVMIKAEVEKENLELLKLYKDDNPAKEKIKVQLDKISKIELKIDQLHVDHQFAIMDKLTSDQKKIFIKHMEPKGCGMRGEMRPPMGGNCDMKGNQMREKKCEMKAEGGMMKHEEPKKN
ncbi:MAG: hypothetical protein PHW79_03890 [Candidatus Marinimicrobia bacterium]|nr:hypothetical protein [Candidatus Neomarinimicrobiota bacterium]